METFQVWWSLLGQTTNNIDYNVKKMCPNLWSSKHCIQNKQQGSKYFAKCLTQLSFYGRSLMHLKRMNYVIPRSRVFDSMPSIGQESKELNKHWPSNSQAKKLASNLIGSHSSALRGF